MALLRNPYPNSKSHGEEATSLYTGAMDEIVAEIVRLCPRALSILRNPLNIGAVRRARCNLMRGLTRHRPTHPRRRRPWAAQSVSSCVRVFHLERRFALTWEHHGILIAPPFARVSHSCQHWIRLERQQASGCDGTGSGLDSAMPVLLPRPSLSILRAYNTIFTQMIFQRGSPAHLNKERDERFWAENELYII